LCERPPEEWPRTPPHGATLEEMGWTAPENVGPAPFHDARIFRSRRIGSSHRIDYMVHEETYRRAIGTPDVVRLARMAITAQVREWEAL
jgi:hypothetical protein